MALNLDNLQPILVLQSTDQNIKLRFNTTQIVEEKKGSSSQFFNPEFYKELCTQGIFDSNHRLIPSPVLPPTTATQTNALVGLIESPFDLFDREGTPVLKNLTVRKVIELVYSCQNINIVSRMQLVGGGVTQVVESDLEWLNKFLSPLTKTDLSHYIQPFPKRDLPDLDIHLICAENSSPARKLIISELLKKIGSLLIDTNREYLEKEIQKISHLDIVQSQDPFEKSLIAKVKHYLKKNDIALLTDIAPEIIRRNCLKKISNNPFGSIIAFGKIELVLTENPSYLLTPDRLAVIFDLKIKKDVAQSLSFHPNSNLAMESLAHRIAKIACIDLDPKEHSFIKSCIYMTFGYHVPINENYKEAITRFIDHVYSYSTGTLTQNGIDFFYRYEHYHFNNSPEEGICTLYNLFSNLYETEHAHIIPHIVKAFSTFLIQEVDHPILEKVRQLLLKNPNDFGTIQECLKLLPSIERIDSSKEYRLSFKTDNEVLSYVIRIGDTNKSSKNEGLSGEILLDLLNSDPSQLIESKTSNLVNELANIKSRNTAYFLLLKTEGKSCSKQIMQYFPEVYFSLLPEQRVTLLENVKRYFYDLVLNQILDSFCSNTQVEENKRSLLWLILLASSPYSSLAFEIWASLKISDEQFNIEFATALLPNNFQGSLKVLRKSLLEASPEAASVLRIQVFSKIKDFKPSDITADLTNIVPDILIWMLKGFQNDPQKGNIVIKCMRELFPKLNLLFESKINFWPLLTLDECIAEIKGDNKPAAIPLMDGLTYIKSKLEELTPEQIENLLNSIVAILTNSKNTLLEEQASTLLNLSVPFCQKLKALKRNSWIPILIAFFKKGMESHRISKKIVFIQPVRTIAATFFDTDLEQLVSNGTPINFIPTALVELLKDSSKPLDGVDRKVLSTFLNQLIIKLKDNVDSIDRLILALKESGISLEESKEMNEAKSLYELRHLDVKSSIDSKIKKLFNTLPTNAPAKTLDRAIISFFETDILFEGNYNKLGVFLICLKAHRPNFDLKAITEKLFAKINDLHKKPVKNPLIAVTGYVSIVDAIFEHRLLDTDKNFTSLFIKTLSAFLEFPKAKEYWDNIFRWYCASNIEIRKVLFPTLIKFLSRRNCQQLYELFLKQLKENQFSEFETKEDRAEYISSVLEALGTFKSHYLLELLVHQQEISVYLPYNSKQMRQWFLRILESVNSSELENPTQLQKLFESLFQQQENPNELQSKLFYFYVNSSNAPDVIRCWKQLVSDFDPAEITKAFTLILANTNPLLRSGKVKENFNLFLRCSIQSRIAHGKSIPSKPAAKPKQSVAKVNKEMKSSEQAFREISPFLWMEFFHELDTKEGYNESLKWSKIALADKKLSQDCNVVMCTVDSILGLQKFGDYLNKDNIKFLEVIFALLGKALQPYERIDNKILKPWEVHIQKLVYNFYNNFTIENTHLLLSGFRCMHASPESIYFDITNNSTFGNLIKLFELDEVHLAITLWRECCTYCSTQSKTPISKYYYPHPLRDSSDSEISFLDHTDKRHEGRLGYSDFLFCCVETVSAALVEKQFSVKTRHFLYDLVYSSFNALLNEHLIKNYQPSPILMNCFRKYLYMVGRKDGDLLQNHTDPLSIVFSKMCQAKIGFENSPLFFETFVLSGFNPTMRPQYDQSKLPKEQKVEYIKVALDKVVSENDSVNATIFSGSFHLILMGKVSHEQLLSDHHQYIRYLKATVEHLKSPFIQNATTDQLRVLRGTPIFVFRQMQALDFKSLCESDDKAHSRAALRELYTALFDGYLEILSLKHRSLIPSINWIVYFQANVFEAAFTEEYEKSMIRYSDVLKGLLDRIGDEFKGEPPQRIFEEFLPYLTKFFDFLTIESRAEEDNARHSAFIINWMEQAKSWNPTLSQMIETKMKSLFIQSNLEVLPPH